MRPTPNPSSPSIDPIRTESGRYARVYDEEIHPLIGQRFADMLLAAVVSGPRASVLEVGCASGGLTVELAHRLGREARIVAVDASAALLDLARARIVSEEHAGRRVSLRTHEPSARLPFDDQAFDLVLGNVALGDLSDPAAAVADWARVTRRGGQLILATPLRGTWSELLDLLREVLMRTRRADALRALDAYLATLPEADAVSGWLQAARLSQPEIELRQWELVFRSAREFFYSSVIEQGPLRRWKDVVGRGAAMHDAFLAVKEAIDTYYAGRPFAVSVFGGRFGARKP